MIAKPKEKYLKIGQKVNVTIKELDAENKKMSLSYEDKEKKSMGSIWRKYWWCCKCNN